MGAVLGGIGMGIGPGQSTRQPHARGDNNIDVGPEARRMADQGLLGLLGLLLGLALYKSLVWWSGLLPKISPR